MFKRLAYYKRFLQLLWKERNNSNNRQKFRRIMRQLRNRQETYGRNKGVVKTICKITKA